MPDGAVVDDRSLPYDGCRASFLDNHFDSEHQLATGQARWNRLNKTVGRRVLQLAAV